LQAVLSEILEQVQGGVSPAHSGSMLGLFVRANSAKNKFKKQFRTNMVALLIRS
jgi:hypothetical protein